MRIVLQNCFFSYHNGGAVVPVFKDISLVLDPFAAAENPVLILGPSGSGKTTLLKLMAGLLGPETDRGSAEASPAGVITALPGSFVFQESRLIPWLSVLENVCLPLKRTMGRADGEERARHFLELVSLSGKTGVFPNELSGGEQRRVSVARAFAYPAPVIYMDEPFQSMDIPLRLELLEMTRSLIEGEGRLAVVVTHDPREAVFLGRRIIVLGKNAAGVVFDERVDLSPEERAFGTEAQSRLEARLLPALRIMSLP
ncbi:MAG: ATP-binding cassette domain-containing protein [Treponema sp.]|nr:ATP-binding cassette domain-containing protein [Treponema sp.]